jgi:hypothetical protein
MFCFVNKRCTKLWFPVFITICNQGENGSSLRHALTEHFDSRLVCRAAVLKVTYVWVLVKPKHLAVPALCSVVVGGLE